jgi:hypothetical protein
MNSDTVKLEPGALNRCPKCGREMTALWLDGDWHFYRCDTHGITVFSPDHPLAVEEPDDSKIRR